MRKTVRTALLVGLLSCVWIAFGGRELCAYLDCSDPSGSTAYFGNDGFMMDNGWTDEAMDDFCSYVSNGSYCDDFSICGACQFAPYGGGACWWGTYCAGCGAGGDNAYYYDAECACEGPETRPA